MGITHCAAEEISHMPQRDALQHPAVWRGNELLDRPDWLVQLDADEIDELIHGAMAGEPTLPRLKPRLQNIQHNLEHGCSATMIRGLQSEHIKTLGESGTMRLFSALASHIGTPISQSASGEKVFSVRDAGYADDDPRARGPNTAKKLSFHTDRCDVIAFCCMKQARRGSARAKTRRRNVPR